MHEIPNEALEPRPRQGIHNTQKRTRIQGALFWCKQDISHSTTCRWLAVSAKVVVSRQLASGDHAPRHAAPMQPHRCTIMIIDSDDDDGGAGDDDDGDHDDDTDDEDLTGS